MKNPNLLKEVAPSESELKELNPESDEITVEQIIDVFAEQFPEFLLALAEENWINGYTQALKDSKSIHNQSQEVDNNDTQNIHQE